MTTDENKEMARRFVSEVWNEQDLDVVDELYRPEYVGHWFLPGGGDAGREELTEFIRSVHHGFPDYEMTIEFIHAEDDLVTMGFTGTGTHEAEFMGIPPGEGEAPTRPIPGHVTSRFEDGQVVEGWATWDSLGLLQALGVLPEDLSQAAPSADD